MIKKLPREIWIIILEFKKAHFEYLYKETFQKKFKKLKKHEREKVEYILSIKPYWVEILHCKSTRIVADPECIRLVYKNLNIDIIFKNHWWFDNTNTN